MAKDAMLLARHTAQEYETLAADRMGQNNKTAVQDEEFKKACLSAGQREKHTMKTEEATKHYTYMLRCADGTIYSGYTTDPSRRASIQNSGKVTEILP